MYKEQSEIENLLLTYPLSQLDLVEADYIPGSSSYRITLRSDEKQYIFIFKNCIEVHHTKRKKPLGKIRFSEIEFNPLIPWNFKTNSRERISFVNHVKDLIKETKEQISETKWEYVEYSSRAAEWNLRLPATMHEVKVYFNNQVITLVFQEIKLKQKPIQASVFQSV